VDERAFWTEVRRWLKIQQQANSQMIAAIEAKFGPFGEQRREDRQSKQPAA
jgi:hypothetical protein